MLVLKFLVIFLVPTYSYAIYIPSHQTNSNTLNSVGVKTLDWQGSNSSVNIHQNYSKVDTNCNHTSHPGDETLVGDGSQRVYNWLVVPKQSERHQSQNKQQRGQEFDQFPRQEWTEGLGQLQSQDEFGQQKADDWMVVPPPKNTLQNVLAQQTSHSGHFRPYDVPSTEGSRRLVDDRKDYNQNLISNKPEPYNNLSPTPKTLVPPKLYSNPNQKNIDDVSEARSPQVYYECGEVKSDGAFAYALSCHQFLNCWKGRGYLQNCPAGTLFNPETSECDFPSKVECMSGPWMPVTAKRSERLINDPRQAVERQSFQPASKQSEGKGIVKQGERKRVSCPDSATGLFPHPSDCSKFLNCANGQTFVQDCGPGTVFNPAISTCDWPSNVNCNDRYGSLIDARAQPQPPNRQEDLENEESRYYSQANQNQYPQEDLERPDTELRPPTKDFQSFDSSQTWHNLKPPTDDSRGNSTYFKVPDRALQPLVGDNQNWNNSDWSQGASKWNNNWGRDAWINTKPPETKLRPPNYDRPTIWNQSDSKIPDSQLRPPTTTYQNWQTDYPSWGGSNRPTGWGQTTSGHVKVPDLVLRPPTDSFHTQTPSGAFNNRPAWNGSVTHPLINNLKPNVQPPTRTLQPPESGQPSVITENVCTSINYYCDMNKCISSGQVCDGTKDCNNGSDEQNCMAYIEQFVFIPGSVLAVPEREVFLNVTLPACARCCLQTKDYSCKSFNYREQDGNCLLNTLNVALARGSLVSAPSYGYYEAKEGMRGCSSMYSCSNNACIDFNKVCDGTYDCLDGGDETNCMSAQAPFQLGLTGGRTANEGFLQVTVYGKKGYVCDDNFGPQSANVACRELGFPLGASQVVRNSNTGTNQNDAIYLMDNVRCAGNETSLKECQFNGWGIHNCNAEEIVGLICKTSTQEKSCPEGMWACQTSDECIHHNFICDDYMDCNDGSDESAQNCQAPVQFRLVGGLTPDEGRIEMKYKNMWGTVCDDDFNDNAAKVVCQSLGYRGNAKGVKNGYFGPGSGMIWLDQVACRGNETGLDLCSHDDFGQHNCDHSEDMGVICTNFSTDLNQVGSERHAQMGMTVASSDPDDLKTPNGVAKPIFPEKCGLRSDDLFSENGDVHFRVVKGSKAKPGEYPWQANLWIKGLHKPAYWCGAVIISERFLLTAAHCLTGYPKGVYVVKTGDYNTQDDREESEQTAYIEEFYIHQKFRRSVKEHRMDNDIAVVKLKGAGFRFDKNVQAICLPDEDVVYEAGMNCTISGFGTDQTGKSGHSHNLRAGWLPVLHESVCKMDKVYGRAITEGMFCAGYLDEGVDACDGDSGGPLACLHNGLFTLYGLTSWGERCGYANKPGVYVKVAHYRDWIYDTITKHAHD